MPFICHIYKVSRNGYYAWLGCLPSKRAQDAGCLEVGFELPTRVPARPMVQSDSRGSQYRAQEYRKLLDQFGMASSMSRRENCYDNALHEKPLGIAQMNYITGPSKHVPRLFRPSQNTSDILLTAA